MKEKVTKHLKAFRTSKLKPGEEVIGSLKGWIGEMMGSGKDTQQNGQFILTNIRACFYRKGLLGEVFETVPIAKITSVETLSRLGYRVIRLHTSHDELAFKTFESKERFKRVYDALESARDRDASGSAQLISPHPQSPPVIDRDECECPFCAELILRKALVCKHCGRDVASARRAASLNSVPVADGAACSVPATVLVICQCGARIKAKTHLLGKTVRCPKCKNPLCIVAN